MPKFIAIHPVDPPVNPEAIAPIARRCKANVSLDAYWVKSWVQLNDQGLVTRVFCEWDGTDADAISENVGSSIPELPASEGIFRMVQILGEDFR